MTDFRELSIHIIEMVIEETDVGISWVVRLFALFITLGGLFLYTKNRVLSLSADWMTISGAVALAHWHGADMPLCMMAYITISTCSAT